MKQMIFVHLNEGKYEAIMKLMNAIIVDLTGDKTTENSNYVSTKKGLEEQIANYSVAWNTAEKLRDEAFTKASTARDELKRLSLSIEAIQVDIDEVTRLALDVASRWEADQFAYNKRKSDSQSVVQALVIIIDDLKSIDGGTDTTNFAEMKDAMNKMKEIGRGNPLLALVEFTATFD